MLYLQLIDSNIAAFIELKKGIRSNTRYYNLCMIDMFRQYFCSVYLYVHACVFLWSFKVCTSSITKMFTNTHTHKRTNTHTRTHTHIYTYTHIHIHTYTHIHIHTYTHTHIHTYTHTHIYTYTQTHKRTHTHMLIFI